MHRMRGNYAERTEDTSKAIWWIKINYTEHQVMYLYHTGCVELACRLFVAKPVTISDRCVHLTASCQQD